MSIANALRASAACYPEDWPPQDGILWEVSRAFLRFDEYMGELQDDMPCFLLLVAEALDDGDTANAARFRRALTWALGSNGNFRSRELGEGAFWWRKELQARAGLEWDGRKFVDGDARWLAAFPLSQQHKRDKRMAGEREE